MFGFRGIRCLVSRTPKNHLSHFLAESASKLATTSALWAAMCHLILSRVAMVTGKGPLKRPTTLLIPSTTSAPETELTKRDFVFGLSACNVRDHDLNLGCQECIIICMVVSKKEVVFLLIFCFIVLATTFSTMKLAAF
ncbi:hypothetical protein NC653_003689 [Populus alba x Populus x berolinensis]|uniref:Uncharacterized protein n=1 Tax=Populus alba x Populus x berolinensis TaxID=444605 RepID=A0AAD6RS74_9ROSI|nr:hypothetical protein NC653_003689 [Populus alba x Populus x berolinensis]